MITAILETNCSSGLSAMIKASNCYKYNSDPDTCEVMQDIRKYNEYDCKVLWEIITYLRNNHV